MKSMHIPAHLNTGHMLEATVIKRQYTALRLRPWCMLPLLPAQYLQEIESLLQHRTRVAAVLLCLCAGMMTKQVSLS